MEDKLDGFKQAISNGLYGGMYYRAARNPEHIKNVQIPQEFKNPSASHEYLSGYYFSEYQHCSLGYRIGFILGFKLGGRIGIKRVIHTGYDSSDEYFEVTTPILFGHFADEASSLIEEKILPEYLEDLMTECSTNGQVFESFYFDVMDKFYIVDELPEKLGSDPEWLYESCLE